MQEESVETAQPDREHAETMVGVRGTFLGRVRKVHNPAFVRPESTTYRISVTYRQFPLLSK